MTGSSETVGVLCAKISTSLMFSHLAEFAKRVKLSGTAEELESFRYLKAVLDGYGYVTSLILHDAYISLPGAHCSRSRARPLAASRIRSRAPRRPAA